LFGNLGRSQPQQQTTTGGSTLFGGLGTSNQPQAQSGLLGGSLLGGLGQSQQTTGQPQQADPNAQSTSTSNLQAAYFDQILERGKKRNNQENGVGGLGDLPTLQLGLGDIARKVRNLGQGGPTAVKGKANDSRA
jgi:nuclear pore complex protein Nup93